TAEYFDGTGTPPGEPSPFIAYEKPLGNTIKPVVLHGDEIAEEIKTDADLEPGKHYICLALEIVNKNLAKGYYKIGCNIALKAKVPDWVEERDAAGPAELRQSNRQGEITIA
ncbi:MAG: hypothetical protein LBR10_06540, partial [Prevotellaceae bacterium]|nr:hypothetical protein [Prevotellaceae bacterium]